MEDISGKNKDGKGPWTVFTRETLYHVDESYAYGCFAETMEGACGAGGAGRILLGSITYNALTGTNCPIGTPIRRIDHW